MYDNAKNEFQIADNCTITYILALSLEVGVIIFFKKIPRILIENTNPRPQMVKIPTLIQSRALLVMMGTHNT